MQKYFLKITAILTFSLLVLGTVVPTAFAASNIDDHTTNQENVEVSINVSNNGDFADLDTNENLNIGVSVLKTGYIKDATIKLEDTNFRVADTNIQDVKSITEDTIELNSVDYGNNLNLSIPVRFNKSDKISPDEFSRENKILFEGTYVDNKGKERKVTKTIKQDIKWSTSTTYNISQSVTRYLKYDSTNTMLTINIKDGIQDNKLPAISKKLELSAPAINGSLPKQAIVSGKNLTSNYKDGKVTIDVTYPRDDDKKIEWASEDEYNVTYLYDTQSKSENIESDISGVVVTPVGNVEGSSTGNLKLTTEVGNIIEAEIKGGSELSKGYIITNTYKQDNKYDTNYQVDYAINFGYADLIDKVNITENKSTFNNTIDATSYTKTTKASIDASELTTVLGDDGEIIVKDNNSNEVGRLNKNTTSIDVNCDRLIFETSKPISEGTINLYVNKKISGDASINLSQANYITTLSNNATVKGLKDENEISSKVISNDIKLTDTKSNAYVDISTDTLSTVVTNENVIINATLETCNVSNRLFKDPTLTFTLPKAVTSIDVKDAKLLYDDELVPSSFDSKGNIITMSLSGTQTKYSSSEASRGTVIRIVADITLDDLATSETSNIDLMYTNSASGESYETTDNLDVVAPMGFVTVNSLNIGNDTVKTNDSNEAITKISANSSAKKAHVSSIIINNLNADESSKDAPGFSIVGRIPYTGNKSLDGNDLGTNVNTTFASGVDVQGIDASILYSDNIDEDVNSSSWSNEVTTNSKSFKIVAKNFSNKTKMTFGYDINVPNGIDYGSTGKATYGIYYNNESVNGISTNLLTGTPVGFTTGNVPLVRVSVELTDDATGDKIDNGGQVKEGQIVDYKVNVINDGKEEAKNVQINTELPDGVKFVRYNRIELTGESSYDTMTIRSYNKKISSVAANGSTSYTYKLKMPSLSSSNDITIKNSLKGDLIDDQVYEVNLKNSQGILNTSLTSYDYYNVKEDQEVELHAQVENPNNVSKDNTKLQVHIADGLTYTGSDYDYNKNKNIVTIDVGSMSSHEIKNFSIPVKVTTNESKEFDNYIVTSSNNNTDVKSNNWTLNKGTESGKKLVDVSASLTTNVNGNDILDTDNLEYYINIKNNGSTTANLDVKDSLPDGLSIKSYDVYVNDNLKRSGIGVVNEGLALSKDDTAKIVIKTDIRSYPNTVSNTYTNKPTITTSEGKNIDINSLDVNVKGTVDSSLNYGIKTETEETSNDNNSKKNKKNKEEDSTAQKQEQSSNVTTYKIAGNAWYDSNYNGVKDSSESPLTGIEIKLYNKDTGEIAKSIDNQEETTKTDANGNYSFEKLSSGKYYAVAEFNTDTYDVTDYKKGDTSSTENSSYVETEIDETKKAITDEINITNSNIFNVNLGLKDKKTFHLKLDKVVSKITISSTDKQAGTQVYNFDNKVAKIEVQAKYVETSTAIVEYKIKVTNVGQIAGYAKSIVDYIPKDMTFNSQLNPNWYVGSDGNGYTTSLSNTVINPGETKEVSIILTKKLTADNTGTERNVAEINESYNEYGLKDISSTNGNKRDDEDDMASSDAVLLTSTGKETSAIIGIAIGMLTVITLAVFEIKKNIINNLYSDII